MNPSTKKISTFHRLAAAVATTAVALALPTTASAAPVRVVIDPGHGGKDPGAMAAGVKEKNTNLQIARLVAAEAKRQGWDIVMTRNTDTFIPLTQRPAKATRSSDVFVSVHSNSTGNKALGNMTIYRSSAGQKLGAAIMGQISKLTPYADIGNRRDVRGLAVLRAAKVPAVIVEVLSVTPASERRIITTPAWQKRYAQGIVRGIANYKHVPYKSGGTTTPVPVTPPVSEPTTSPVTGTQPLAR